MAEERAFSLIELLVVIAILVVLAALLFPVFSAARNRAKIDSCISQLHQVGLGILMYRSDNDGEAWLTYVGFADGQGPSTTAGKYRWPWNEWQPAEPYLKDDRLVRCTLPNRDPLEGQTTVEGGFGVYHGSYTSYIYREILPPGVATEDTPITTWYPVDPAPGRVVAFCRNHTTDKRISNGLMEFYEGIYPIVREDGSASIAKSSEIRLCYLWQDGSWHDEESATFGSSSEVWRFPNESWPPSLPWL